MPQRSISIIIISIINTIIITNIIIIIIISSSSSSSSGSVCMCFSSVIRSLMFIDVLLSQRSAFGEGGKSSKGIVA